MTCPSILYTTPPLLRLDDSLPRRTEIGNEQPASFPLLRVVIGKMGCQPVETSVFPAGLGRKTRKPCSKLRVLGREQVAGLSEDDHLDTVAMVDVGMKQDEVVPAVSVEVVCPRNAQRRHFENEPWLGEGELVNPAGMKHQLLRPR